MENAIEIVHVTKIQGNGSGKQGYRQSGKGKNPRHHRAEWVRQDGAL